MASGSRPCSTAVWRMMAMSSRQLLVGAAAGEEAVAEAAGPPGGGLGVAADHDRDARLGRAGPGVGVGERGELAVVRRGRPRPRACGARATWSSVRLPRSAKGTPMASNSSSSQPTPMPSSTRPPESWSRVAISLARMIGLRCGRMRMPVPRRIVRGGGGDEGQPDERVGDVGVARGRASCRSGCTGTPTRSRRARATCSTVQSDSMPAASAAWPMAMAPSAVPIGPTLANITPNFIASPVVPDLVPRRRRRSSVLERQEGGGDLGEVVVPVGGSTSGMTTNFEPPDLDVLLDHRRAGRRGRRRRPRWGRRRAGAWRCRPRTMSGSSPSQ